jgi:hypothetical protein
VLWIQQKRRVLDSFAGLCSKIQNSRDWLGDRTSQAAAHSLQQADFPVSLRSFNRFAYDASDAVEQTVAHVLKTLL